MPSIACRKLSTRPASVTSGGGWECSAGAAHRRRVERTDGGSRLLTEKGPMLRLGLDRELRHPRIEIDEFGPELRRAF